MCCNFSHENGFDINFLTNLSVFFRKVPFLTAALCQFRGVGQGMKEKYMYLWYSLSQAQ